MASIVLTRPMGSGSNVPGNITTNILINAGETVTVDSCPSIVSVSVKWIYTLIDATANKVLTAEVLATHRNGSNPTHNRYGVIGDAVMHQTNVSIVAGEIGLDIKNLGPNSITANIVRIQILG